jgi:tetratricopeptide (TPR) repeat protein
LAVAFGWFTVRWQLGNMLAELTLPTEPNAKQIAELAVNFAPSDPLAKWLKANTQEEVFTPESIQNLLVNNQDIVRSSPHNFTWWVELGRAYEQAEQPENAEKAFLRAVELAPAYTYPHWQLGNFYLRNDEDEKAFAELKKAAENNAVYREQVFSLAWDFYEKDTERLEKIAGDSPDVRAGLAKFYAAKERPDDSLRMWNTLSAEEKESNEDVAKLIAQALYDKLFFRQSLEFVRDLKIEPNARNESVQNGGFEEKIEAADRTFFGWKVLKQKKWI